MPRIALLFLLVPAFFGQAPKDEPLDQNSAKAASALLRRVSQRMVKVQRLHMDFVQEQSTVLLAKPLVSSGRLHLRADPGCLVMELTKPRRTVVRSDARTHQVYHPEQNRAERYLFESNELAKALLSILTADLSRIEEAFLVSGYERKQESEQVQLRLRDVAKRTLVDYLQLSVPIGGAELSEISFRNSDGEETLMRLSNQRLILPSTTEQERDKEKEVFDRPLPDGVKLVTHRVPSPKPKD